MSWTSWTELGPNLTHRWVPDIWFEEPGSWADLGTCALHMWWQEPWETYRVTERTISPA